MYVISDSVKARWYFAFYICFLNFLVLTIPPLWIGIWLRMQGQSGFMEPVVTAAVVMGFMVAVLFLISFAVVEALLRSVNATAKEEQEAGLYQQ